MINYCWNCLTEYEVFKQNYYDSEKFCCEKCASHYKRVQRKICDDNYINEFDDEYEPDLNRINE